MLIDPMSVVTALALWALLIACGAAVAVVIVMAAIAMNRSESFRLMQGGLPREDEYAAPVRIARKRVCQALGAGLAVLVVGGAFGGGLLRYGLGLALLPGLTACAVVAVLALPLPSATTDLHASQRTASLTPRKPWTYARRIVLVQPIAVAMLLAVYLTFTSLMATRDGESAGRSIRTMGANGGGAAFSEAGPYPGVYYAVPLAVVTALLVALTCAALWRVAHAPSVPDARFEDADRRWRIAVTRFVTFLSSGTMLTYAAGVLYFAGNATRLAGTGFDTLSAAYADDVYPTLGVMQMIAGGAAAVLAAIYLLLAVAALTRLRAGSRGGAR